MNHFAHNFLAFAASSKYKKHGKAYFLDQSSFNVILVDVTQFMTDHTCYLFRCSGVGEQTRVDHNLTSGKCEGINLLTFEKMELDGVTGNPAGITHPGFYRVQPKI